MTAIRVFLLISAMLFSAFASAQLELIDAPKEGAFLAQNVKSKSANYLLTGVVKDVSYNTLFITVYQSGRQMSRSKVRLAFSGSQYTFKQMIFLPAGKYIYKISYQLIGPTTVMQNIDDIVVGDVFLIQGQSNAVAASYNKFDTAYYDKYCRSFGTSSTNGTAVSADSNWYRTYADGAYTRGSVGQWGAVMAQVLVDSFSVPICLINGAVGGTRITQHQRDPNNPTNLSTIYGRLLHRVRKANLDQHIRGILYFQGESDGRNAPLHDTLFQKLHGFWKTDYPNFEKLYVIQVRAGCGGPSIQLRDKQRLLEEVLPNCQTVSANGLNSHDGCHYGFVNGYELLGHQMSALVGRDFYGSTRQHINAPSIKSCVYANADQTEVTLQMKYPNDSIFADNGFTKLFRTEGDPTVLITGGFIRNNQVVLQLNKSSCGVTGVTYDGLARTQPWVKGKTGMGLVSFYNVPIHLPKPPETYHLCKNAKVDIGVETIKGCSYSWQELPTGRTYNTSKATISAYDSTSFLFVTQYASSACVTSDSTWITIVPDPIEVPKLGNDVHLCLGDQITFEPDTTGFRRFTWNNSNGTSQSFQYVTDSAETVRLSARSLQGCMYADTVEVTYSNPLVKLPNAIKLCPDHDTLIEVTNKFKSYVWNNVPNGNTYRATQGDLKLTVMDAFGCSHTDSVTIAEYEERQSLITKDRICDGDFVVIDKPNGIKRWYFDSIEKEDRWELKKTTGGAIDILDSNGCWSVDSIQIEVLELPYFELGNDTGLCVGESITIHRPEGERFYWQNELVASNKVEVDMPDTYVAKVLNKEGCAYSDTLTIWQYALPTLHQFYDTTICQDSMWNIPLSDSIEYVVNGESATDTLNMSQSGKYTIRAQNADGCISVKSIDVKTVKCQLGLETLLIDSTLTVFPNPFFTSITIQHFFNKDATVKTV